MCAILFRRKASGPPTADSLVQMLIQALHSQDNNLLEVSMIILCKITSPSVRAAHTVISALPQQITLPAWPN